MKVLSGERAVALRESKGFKQRDVTERCGISKEAISRLENGHIQHPRPKTINSLAKLYGCSVDDFYVEVKEVLPDIVNRELMKRLESIKNLLVGTDGEIVDFTIEFTLKNSNYRTVKHSGKYHARRSE